MTCSSALMRGVDQPLSGFIGDRPRHAHGLRRAERQVETRHRKSRLPRHPTGVDVCRPAPSRGSAQLVPRDRILQHPEHPEQVLFAHHRPDRDPVTVVQPGQSAAEEPPRRGPGLGVVPGQRRRRMTGSVGAGDRRHEVPVPGPQTHPADRHRHRLGPHQRPRGDGRGADRATRHTGLTGHHPTEILAEASYSCCALFGRKSCPCLGPGSSRISAVEAAEHSSKDQHRRGAGWSVGEEPFV
jgi:hypothetical protein